MAGNTSTGQKASLEKNLVDLLYKNEVFAVVGAAMEVYNNLGPGFLEAVYQEALEIELTERNIPFIAQPEVKIIYKGKTLKKAYIPDLTIYGKMTVEIKAIDKLTSKEEAQIINQLKATGYKVGILLNFGSDEKLDWQRKILDKKNSSPKQFNRIKTSQ